MRNGQNNNKRMRGRNRSKGGHHHHQNPLSRVYESNGQDVKIRGTASHIAEKYLQLARDAQSSGDSIASENYYQHAEHYFRLIAAAQEQLRQTQPYFQQQPGGNSADDGYDDGDEQPQVGEPYAPQAQPFYPREQQQPPQQHFQPQQQPQPQSFQPRSQQQPPQEGQGDVDRLPSFITGGQGQPQHGQSGNGQDGDGQNGYEGTADRFPLHRRRRRHRGGPRDYASEQGTGNDGPTQAGADSTEE
ncbi:MAG: DUF4167 domain-containing protein [Xanthobacteraceae bacterium]